LRKNRWELEDFMSGATPTAAHIRQFLLEYLEATGIGVPELATQIEASTPGVLSMPVAAVESFLRAVDRPSESFLNICARFAAQIRIDRTG
jgi:hypothetical protein